MFDIFVYPKNSNILQNNSIVDFNLQNSAWVLSFKWIESRVQSPTWAIIEMKFSHLSIIMHEIFCKTKLVLDLVLLFGFNYQSVNSPENILQD